MRMLRVCSISTSGRENSRSKIIYGDFDSRNSASLKRFLPDWWSTTKILHSATLKIDDDDDDMQMEPSDSSTRVCFHL